MAHLLTEAVAVEFIATGFLLIAVVGSGIMAERLSGGNQALALLANSIATGGALVALILAFGPRSGAHMNPVVTLAAALTGGLRWHSVLPYVAAQVAGGIAGVWLAHVMFDLPVLQLSTHARHGIGQWVAEADRHLRIAGDDLGPPAPTQLADHRLRGRRLHHRRLLVYRFHLVRQSGDHHCPHPVRQFFRNSSDRRA